MDYQALCAELQVDPLDRNYAGMTDAGVLADLLSEYRMATVATVDGQAIFEAVTRADYLALEAGSRSLLHAVIGMGNVRIDGRNTRAALLGMFGPTTETRTNLSALQTRPCSRASELGLGNVKLAHVHRAREGV